MAGRGTAGRGRQQSGVTGSDCSEFGGKVPTVKGRCQQLRAEDRSCHFQEFHISEFSKHYSELWLAVHRSYGQGALVPVFYAAPKVSVGNPYCP